MTNQEIAKTFQTLGRIMELHGENPYKVRSYQNAYRNLRSLETPLESMTDEAIGQLKGVGKAIGAKIRELLDTGKLQTLEKYRAKTPAGIEEMLQVKGFGPKKIRTVWKELGVENVGELLYACNENRLVELKGFGQKTQEDLRQKLEYYLKSKGKFHFAALEEAGEEVRRDLAARFPTAKISFAGKYRRRCSVLSEIELLVAGGGEASDLLGSRLKLRNDRGNELEAETREGLPVRLRRCAPAAFGGALFFHTGSADFLEAFPNVELEAIEEEMGVFAQAGMPFIEPELREDEWIVERARREALPDLITVDDIKGVVHAHSHYSDGINSLREMAAAARDQGYGYLAISDHSRSAFYANGLSPERVIEQMEEVDALNREMAPFRIFKGIESDILNDGALDYEAEVLERFEFVIASVHSNLRMDEERATRRLIRAVENPHTKILGHPTGRLLLSREGYPLDHYRLIDACAANGVAIELNANPFRLDLDWRWIPYALEKQVKIAVNPDAHSIAGIGDIRYGVYAGRKGGLDRDNCLNALNAQELARYWSLD